MEEIKKLDKSRLPKHVGLILDGNRRWARKKGLDANTGHEAGYQTITEILEKFFEAGIRYLSIYALSLENVKKRSEKELAFIYNLIKIAVERAKSEEIVKRERIKFKVIGRIELLPNDVIKKIHELEEFTKDYDGAFINICIMYDGQAEIIDAVKKIIKEDIPPEQIDEKLFRKYLYDKGTFPPVDYIIRTGMEDGARISGFLLWDASYAEFKFRKDYWPDYNERMLIEDLLDYSQRKRRMGK
ncbi:MAG: polyprenyl diphosphate synthase [Promethearchaeota archaeon]